MDALAGYGSDDSSVSEARPVPPAKTGLSGLVGDVSDDSEDGGHERECKASTNPEQPPPTKKLKVQSPPQSEQTSVKLLPPPILSTSESDPIIYWKINYLQQPVREGDLLLDEKVPTVEELKAKLQKLASNLSPGETCWADHLRAQHEFHNPHFFSSVVEHFGLKDSLGSFVDTRVVQDYDRQLFPVVVTDTTMNDQQVP
jgi:hypothetical protein